VRALFLAAAAGLRPPLGFRPQPHSEPTLSSGAQADFIFHVRLKGFQADAHGIQTGRESPGLKATVAVGRELPHTRIAPRYHPNPRARQGSAAGVAYLSTQSAVILGRRGQFDRRTQKQKP
jgi:hypothetical protein